MAIFSFFSKKKKSNDEQIKNNEIESSSNEALSVDLETEKIKEATMSPIEKSIEDAVSPMADILTNKPVLDPAEEQRNGDIEAIVELKKTEEKIELIEKDDESRVQEHKIDNSEENIEIETIKSETIEKHAVGNIKNESAIEVKEISKPENEYKPKEEKKGFFSSLFSKKEKEDLDRGLEKTKSNIFSKLAKAVAGKSKVDDEVLDNLEEILITSDVGVETTLKIIKKIEDRVSKDKYLGTDELNRILKEEITSLLSETQSNSIEGFNFPKRSTPYVIMVVGVNGVGKTTTIGKLAYQFKSAGKKVMLGASDTFRAAAVDQLTIWAQRVDVPIVTQGMNADPASVAFDTLKSAIANDVDVVLIDTAGRLHNKVNLMNELSKIRNVMRKLIPDAPHEVLLVLDATTGQNAIEQAKQFTAATDVTTLALTKLDGTAKGGVAIGISDQFNIPIKYIGVGEKMEQLQLFNKEAFVDSLFGAE